MEIGRNGRKMVNYLIIYLFIFMYLVAVPWNCQHKIKRGTDASEGAQR